MTANQILKQQKNQSKAVKKRRFLIDWKYDFY